MSFKIKYLLGTSLVPFLAMYGLQKLQHSDPDLVIVATTSILGTIQWVLWLLLPLIQVGYYEH